MKRVLLILGLAFGLGFTTVQAQDDRDPNQTKSAKEHNDDGVMTKEESRADHENRSKAGEVRHETGDKAGKGAKKVGKKVGDGASWTWDKAKHNKATKNVFNQPDEKESN